MLENIKLILNLTDDKYDNVIELYMSKVESLILEYCNIKQLTAGLEGFIEDKVVSIMNLTITGGIKSVSRGDTRIEYVTQTSSNGVSLTDSDKKILNTYRKVRCF